MTDAEDLFRAVLAEPDDDTPRLIYADYLEERADPRAEFIRLQCERAALPEGDLLGHALRARERVLLDAHRRRWNGEVHRRLGRGPLRNQVGSRRRPIRGWTYRRGFVEEVVIHARVLLDHPDALFEIGPLRQLVIWDARGLIPALGESPHLGRVASVEFRADSLDRPDARALTRALPLFGMTRLRQADLAYWSLMTGLPADDPRLRAALGLPLRALAELGRPRTVFQVLQAATSLPPPAPAPTPLPLASPRVEAAAPPPAEPAPAGRSLGRWFRKIVAPRDRGPRKA